MLPSAVPGILAGVILAIGRIVGESAALIFTAGTNPVVPDSLFASTRTLSVHMYALMSEGLYTDPVSYTHLDVYKRQAVYRMNGDFDVTVVTSDRPVQMAAMGLSLIHI